MHAVTNPTHNVSKLVWQIDDRIVTDSQVVADEFGKEHKHVMRDIKGMTKSGHTPSEWFQKIAYIHPQNKQRYERYEMTEEGLAILVMGYTTEKAMKAKVKYVREFTRMKEYIQSQQEQPQFQIPQTYADALQLAADQAKQLEQQAPKIEHYESVMSAEGSHTAGDVGKVYGLSAQKLNKILVAEGWIYKQGGRYHVRAEHALKGYFTEVTYAADSNNVAYGALKITHKGRAVGHPQ